MPHRQRQESQGIINNSGYTASGIKIGSATLTYDSFAGALKVIFA